MKAPGILVLALLSVAAVATSAEIDLAVRLPLPRGVLRTDRPADVLLTREEADDGVLILGLPGPVSTDARHALRTEAERLGRRVRIVSLPDAGLGPIVTAARWAETPGARHDPGFLAAATDALLGDLRPEVERRARAEAERDRARLARIG